MAQSTLVTVTTTTTLTQPWLFAVSTAILVLETLVGGEGLPGTKSFSDFHPSEVASIAVQLKQENLPYDLLDRLQAVMEATDAIQQPWDEGRSVRFNCQSLVPIAPVADWLLLAERESTRRYPEDSQKRYWFLAGFLALI